MARRTRDTHPFSIHDLVAMDRISDLRAAPNGEWLAFTVRATDLENNKGRPDVWLCDIDGHDLRRLTAHEKGSSHARWTPDSRSLYFLSGRSGSSQVWQIAIDGGEAVQITDLPLDIGSFALSPKGTHLAVSLEVFPEAKTLQETKERLEREEKRKSSGRVYDRLFIRHWDAWKDGRRSHLFIVPLKHGENRPVIGGAAVDLMKRMDADAPSKPFGGAEEYTFTPDGKSVVFACRNVGRKEAWSTHFDLYIAPIDGRKRPQVLVDGQGATLTHPVFSPEGKTLAYLAMQRPGYESDRLRIVLKPWKTGPTKVLTEKWDRSPHAIVWSADSKTIYTHADDLGYHPLFAVNASNGRVSRIVGSGKVSAIAVAGRRLVYGLCHHQSPVELFATSGAGKGRQITRINAARLAEIRSGDSEQFTFKGWNNDTVRAWIIKPVDFNPRKKYPVAFLIHGGPQGSFGQDFHYRWNPQVYAGAGYAAVMVDFHASTGYGQDFVDAINQHWGDRPLVDLQNGLATALERYKWLDAKRVAALGASFGGYMIHWIHGVWQQPFRCFVCHDGNMDQRMAYYETEELWFPEWECGGPEWQVQQAHTRHNPIDHVKNWKKPTLIIHGQKDFRVVDTQGVGAFNALQRKGVPSRLLYFPDENHWVLKPHNSIQWHEEVLGWLSRWCR